MKANIVGMVIAKRDLLWQWCRSLDLKPVTHSRYVNGRLEKWFCHSSNLQSVACGRAAIHREPPVPLFVADIGDTYLPTWNSVLVCGGNTSILWHRDHSHFAPRAVMVNLGTCMFGEHTGTAEEEKDLVDGDVIDLDISVTHRARQTSTERFSITFRTIHPKYMSKVIS